MINRCEFERYLLNRCNCQLGHGTDVTLCHEVNGKNHYASFGNHENTRIHKGEARRFLKDLGFDDKECKDILDQF